MLFCSKHLHQNGVKLLNFGRNFKGVIKGSTVVVKIYSNDVKVLYLNKHLYILSHI